MKFRSRSRGSHGQEEVNDFRGNLDGTSGRLLSGWAWNPAEPDRRLVLEVFIDDKLVGTVESGLFRPDLLANGIGDGWHGFNYMIRNLTASGAKTVKIVDPETGKTLLGPAPIDWSDSPTESEEIQLVSGPIPDDPIIGALDSAEANSISGWAWNPMRPDERCWIEIIINGIVINTIRADQEREDLVEAGVGDGRYMFEISPNLSLLYPGSYEVSARVVGTGMDLLPRRSLVYAPETHILGRARLAHDGQFIEGWAWNRLHPNESVSVGLFDGEVLLSQELAFTHSSELEADGIGKGAHGFKIPIPKFSGSEARRLSVKALPSCVELAGSPLEYQPDLSRGTLVKSPTTNQKPADALVEVLLGLARIGKPDDGLHVGFEANEMQRLSALGALRFLHEPADHRSGRHRLEFPAGSEPLVSVVIPVHNQFEYTWRCLNSLLIATWGIPTEVILVDDASSDQTRNIGDTLSGVIVVRQDENRQFVESCNNGATHAKGKYLYFLNNDTQLHPHAVEALVSSFDRQENIGVVGSKLIYANGQTQEVGCLIRQDGETVNVGRYLDPGIPELSYLRDCHYVSGASLMIPRRLFEELGGFDERYKPAYSEDADLCMRVRDQGLRVVVEPASEVIHFENISTEAKVSKKTKKLMKSNHQTFKETWSNTLLSHPLNDVPWQIAKDLDYQLRCLFIDWRTPRTDEDAGSYAALQEMRALQANGVKVTFMSADLEYANRHTALLQSHGVECIYRPQYTSVQEFMESRGDEFDLVYGMRYATIEWMLSDIRRLMPQARLIFNCADVHFIREKGEARLLKELGDPGAKAKSIQAKETRHRELAVMAESDLTIVYNDGEQEELSKRLPHITTIVMPWSVPVRSSIPSWELRSGLAILGSYQHKPNVDAVEYFVSEVWPLLSSHDPNLEFHVYGSGMEKLGYDHAHWSDLGVHVHGYVDDLGAMFDRHRVFVAPMRFGAGIKGKVVMAMCNGIPVVSTAIAAEGIGLNTTLGLDVSSEPRDMAQSILQFLENAGQWNTASKAGLEFSRSHFSETGLVATIELALKVVGLTGEQEEREK